MTTAPGAGPPGRPLGPQDTPRWLPPVLLLLLAATLVVAGAAGAARTGAAVATAAADGLLTVVLVSPLLVIALRGVAGAARTVLALLALILCSRWALGLPRVGVFAPLEWNWQGKTLELLWLAALFVCLWRWARQEAGVRWSLEPGSGRAVAPVVVGVFLLSALLSLWALADQGGQADPVSVERLLFDMGHPNLTEELLVRGAMLAVLDRACGTPWRFLGARVGWGLVLTTSWFGLWHGAVLTGDGFVLDPGAIVATGAAGLLIGWVRARSGSLWPAYLAHCAPELGLGAATMVWAALSGAPVLA
ncbi:CPBP family intramembrane glutamic endopeptidase [Streptomyces spiramenti]|uniref:CPBP family intramembrane metalloprotease n=1 Tax=Streptomyces spiramenti TaxID=2720606 RepID=A0ABX1AMR4_9ACTN|nr:CPBP family intramembrane glutamic endopeptidase [Streptomyces spiramenti]NJP67351.1 CPBP family intramembrane metalloprotease [Streptomyces spiramenti]